MPLAGQIAGRFLASHHSFDRDDARQIACLALVEAIDSYSDSGIIGLGEYIIRSVESAFRRESKRRAERHVLAPIVIILGLEDGEPLNSVRDLRSARSFNPRADIPAGLREAIGEVRASAVIQCSPQHAEHDYYDWTCRLSRQRVKQIRQTKARHTEIQIMRAPESLAA